MKGLIIYKSVSKGNTKKVADVLAEKLEAEAVEPEDADRDLSNYDLVGFGSGIYVGKHSKELINFVKDLKKAPDKGFIFSTAGSTALKPVWHYSLKKALKKKGVKISGEFICPGYSEEGPCKLIGGANKGRPNKKDLKEAKDFAERLKKKTK